MRAPGQLSCKYAKLTGRGWGQSGEGKGWHLRNGCPGKSHPLDPARSAEACVLSRILQGTRYEMLQVKREAREGRWEPEGGFTRKLWVAEGVSAWGRVSERSCSKFLQQRKEELAGLSGAQGAGRIGSPPIFAEPSAVCNLSPHLLPSFITKKGQSVCADPNNEGVQKCKSELRLGSAVEDLRSLLVERKRLDRAPSSPSLLPHRPHWRAVAWITF